MEPTSSCSMSRAKFCFFQEHVVFCFLQELPITSFDFMRIKTIFCPYSVLNMNSILNLDSMWREISHLCEDVPMFPFHPTVLYIVEAPSLQEIEPRECSICLDSFQIETICHPAHDCCSSFCNEVLIHYLYSHLTLLQCMTSYINGKIDEAQSYEIPCPAIKCGWKLILREVEPLLDPIYKSKRELLSLTLTLASMQDFR